MEDEALHNLIRTIEDHDLAEDDCELLEFEAVLDLYRENPDDELFSDLWVSLESIQARTPDHLLPLVLPALADLRLELLNDQNGKV